MKKSERGGETSEVVDGIKRKENGREMDDGKKTKGNQIKVREDIFFFSSRRRHTRF